jgi:hypothetical protein
VLVAHVNSAKIRLQIDVGFGDAITPEAVNVEFPALLARSGFGQPRRGRAALPLS